MKSYLLAASLLMVGFAAHGQKIKAKPSQKDWRKTATPQQSADTLEALEAVYLRARERYNILNALATRAEERANDSINRLRASQVKEGSKVPAATQQKEYMKRPLPK